MFFILFGWSFNSLSATRDPILTHEPNILLFPHSVFSLLMIKISNEDLNFCHSASYDESVRHESLLTVKT